MEIEQKTLILSENTLQSQYIPEFEKLLTLYIERQPQNVLEIGSLYGWSLQHWIYYAPKNARIVSLDLPVRLFCGPYDFRVKEQERLQKEEWPKWVKQSQTRNVFLIQGASQDLKSFDLVKKYLPKGIDFLFIDGDHRYESVKQDWLMYKELVNKNGIIAFHDIGPNEEGGVNKFWLEIKSNYKTDEFLLDPTGGKGIGVIYV